MRRSKQVSMRRAAGREWLVRTCIAAAFEEHAEGWENNSKDDLNDIAGAVESASLVEKKLTVRSRCSPSGERHLVSKF